MLMWSGPWPTLPSSCGGAVSTQSGYSKVGWIDFEAGCGSHGLHPSAQACGGYGCNSPTAVAYDVDVGGFRWKVIDSRPVTEVAVNQESALFESIQCPVHGRLVDPVAGVGEHIREDGGGGEMLTVALSDHSAHGAACPGDPQPLAAQRLDEVFWSDVHCPLPSYSSYLTISLAERLRVT